MPTTATGCSLQVAPIQKSVKFALEILRVFMISIEIFMPGTDFNVQRPTTSSTASPYLQLTRALCASKVWFKVAEQAVKIVN